MARERADAWCDGRDCLRGEPGLDAATLGTRQATGALAKKGGAFPGEGKVPPPSVKMSGGGQAGGELFCAIFSIGHILA